jgi:hypothetical protein
MKKILLLVFAIGMMAGTMQAQKLYIRLGVGGGVGLKQYDSYNWYNETETNSADNIEIKSMGLGGGLNVNLGLGYKLSDYVAIELGVNEFIGLKKKINQSSTSGSYSNTYEQKMSGMMLQIVPAIVITPGLEKINPYARFGMIVGVMPSVTENFSSTVTNMPALKASTLSEAKSKLSGGLPLGFTAAAGASFSLGEKLDFFAELVFNGITYAPSKGELKEWTIDGADQLPSATTKEKEWTFEKEFDADAEIPDGSPDKVAKVSYNFSNVELNIGIKLKL